MSSQSNTKSLLELFAEETGQGGNATDVFTFLRLHPGASLSEKLAVCLADQSARWNRGQPLDVEEYFNRLPELNADNEAKSSLITSDNLLRDGSGVTPEHKEYLSRFSDNADPVADRSHISGAERGKTNKIASVRTPGASLNETESVVGEVPGIVSGGTSASAIQPLHVGKYRILRVLGDGGFGRVYLAIDETLDRYVAIKIPHEFRLEKPEDIEAYSTEAKVLAKLMHPAIVQVYDFDWTADGRCYAVTGYIDGCDLAKKMKNDRFSFLETANLVARVAEALHYSHSQGIIHRDVKPANILIDGQGQPFVTDFGIALKVEDWGKEGSVVGTPAYMSPEQVRGESHLVDGRSDVFSLGVVLFEMLSGQRPFGRTRQERQQSRSTPSVREIDHEIPQELERICLKAMSYRVTDRYEDAQEMGQDLQHFIDDRTNKELWGEGGSQGNRGGELGTHVRSTGDLAIVPRGLRSFERDDAEFFLNLLPGLKNRDGVPECIQFWRQRILDQNTESTFRIGVIYGPSGCGKSSFLKAGVLPGLPKLVTQVYLEATPQDTETRLLAMLRRKCPKLPQDRSLSETMAILRQGSSGASNSKVLIVIDQFEQWLHGRRGKDAVELVEALRHCDGVHLQCIVSVRDDFWMAVTQFMDDVEVPLVSDNNIAAIGLFSVHHTEKVLTAMGRSYGALPQSRENISKSQNQFIELAVQELAQDGEVIPVHLALFAEMVKDKPWEPAVLRELGGAAGVGVTFLEDTFNGRKANLQHRVHQQGARAVLTALLAEEGDTIKGRMRSYDELLEATEYGEQKHDFDVLLRILDSELRLITPTEPTANRETSQDDASQIRSGRGGYFQLTHDYLVPSVTEWVFRKQKETRRGRAELLLTERAKMWKGKPSSRSLPSFLEWGRILCFTSRQKRAHLHTEQQMMKGATRHHLQRLSIFGVLVLAALLSVRDYISRNEARALVQSLHSAATEDATGIIAQLDPVRNWAEPMLVSAMKESTPGSRAQVHLRLARLETDLEQAPFLIDRMLSSSPETLRVINDALISRVEPGVLAEALWPELENADNDSERRFRAAAALSNSQANEVSAVTRWESVAGFVSAQLIQHVNDDRELAASWLAVFFPIRDMLLGSLTATYGDTDRRDLEREVAASILRDYTLARPIRLMELLLTANVQQHRILLPSLARERTEIVPLLRECFDTHPADDVTYEPRSRVTERRAHAAALLFGLNESEATWNGLTQTEDRELQSFLENRLSLLAPSPEVLYAKLASTDATELRASLIRVFGGMSSEKQVGLGPSLRNKCVLLFESALQTEPEASVHSAAEWALKTWGETERLKQLTEQLAGRSDSAETTWYISKLGHTMAKFRGPIRFEMGSPPDEPNRDASDEEQTIQFIDRDFAIGTKEVTMTQFLEFLPTFPYANMAYSETLDCPVVAIMWHRMADYCNWLSRQEGIPDSQLCYRETEQYYYEPEPDFLSRTGYRLPTELEWEYACSADTNTTYFWGNAPSLASRYMWHSRNYNGVNSPVGTVCPNAFGMFDMLGNVAEITQSVYRSNSASAEGGSRDSEDNATFSRDVELVLRGSSSSGLVMYLRTANKRPVRAESKVAVSIGFRLARTLD